MSAVEVDGGMLDQLTGEMMKANASTLFLVATSLVLMVATLASRMTRSVDDTVRLNLGFK